MDGVGSKDKRCRSLFVTFAELKKIFNEMTSELKFDSEKGYYLLYLYLFCQFKNLYRDCGLRCSVRTPGLADYIYDIEQKSLIRSNRTINELLCIAHGNFKSPCTFHLSEFENWVKNYKKGLALYKKFVDATRDDFQDSDFRQDLMWKATQLKEIEDPFTVEQFVEFYQYFNDPIFPQSKQKDWSNIADSAKQTLMQMANRSLPVKDGFIHSMLAKRQLSIAESSSGLAKINAYKKAFDHGHYESAIQIANLYENDKKILEALKWYMLAEKFDKTKGIALFEIHAILARCNLVNEAKKFLKKSAICGCPKALILMSKLCEFENNQRSIELLERAVEAKDPDSIYSYANCFYYGNSNIPRSLPKAFELYQRAAALGHEGARFCYARMFLRGEVVRESKAIAYRIFSNCQSHPQAKLIVAEQLSESSDHKEEMISALKTAALSGSPESVNRLGKIYSSRLFTSSCISNLLFTYAHLMGSKEALCNIVKLWQNSAFGTKKVFDPKEFLLKAMDLGDSSALVEYAESYLDGTEQLSFFKKAARLQNPEAYWRLGQLYENGHTVKQSYEKALIFYSAGAKRQHAQSLLSLGKMYEYGRGVQKSRSIANSLYKKSADLGSWDAKFASFGMLLEDCGTEFFNALENAEKKIGKIIDDSE